MAWTFGPWTPSCSTGRPPGRPRVTTVPAPISAPSPIRTPGRIVAFAPMTAFRPTVTPRRFLFRIWPIRVFSVRQDHIGTGSSSPPQEWNIRG